MSEKLSLLGLGSNNSLNQDLIDKMRKSDESVQIKPIERKMDTIDFKVDRLEELNKKTEEFADRVSVLGNEMTYAEVSPYTSNNNVWIEASAGVKPQDFSLNVIQKARSDMYQSNKTNSTLAVMNTSDEELKYKIGNGMERTLSIPANSTITDLKDILNETGDMSATIIKVSETEYRLSIKSLDTGEDNELVFSSEGADLKNNLGLSDTTNHIQNSQNSIFEYNGIEMERNTNKIEDIIFGVKIELADVGETLVEIKPNYETILNNVSELATLYNEMNDLVKANVNGSEENDGLFRTNREVRGMMKQINDVLFKSTSGTTKGSLNSIVDLGFEKNKDGSLKFDQSKLEKGLLDNFDSLSNLFSDSEEGIFSNLEKTMGKITNKSNTGSLNELNKSIEKEDDRLADLLERNKAKLDKQYELMEKKFAAFDALIAKMNAGFDSLKLQIEQSTASPQ